MGISKLVTRKCETACLAAGATEWICPGILLCLVPHLIMFCLGRDGQPAVREALI